MLVSLRMSLFSAKLTIFRLALTIRNNGSALIPCYPSGVVYDLFECLTQNLENAGLNNVPMFFISPVADSSLAYSNILAEWLSSAKQNKVYLPDDPFPHAFYLRNSKLKHYKHVFSDGFSKDFRQVISEQTILYFIKHSYVGVHL